ncbi:hypothetical protein DSO57_1014615 [Entomophthora muscae]|uniref:Uncharacterized protein n=1 Tax=Entomophthora muscae TaxID=34485 RepID=A0ACC2UR67_9FUNG|nr:hypothetical protein DSO57_1014615 [Entomophthora muscae]
MYTIIDNAIDNSYGFKSFPENFDSQPISPSDLQAALMNHVEVSHCVVVPQKSTPKAYVALNQAAGQTIKQTMYELRQFINSKLPPPWPLNWS